MSPISTRYHARAVALGVVCAAGGVGAGAVASAGASTGHSSSTTAHHARAGHGKAGHARLRALRTVARHSVSGDVVVDTKQGFETISFQRGTVDSVSGDQLTITEGGPKAAQRQETVTVPASVHVRDNGKPATMSSVTAGQHVLVLTLPKRTVVVARTPKQAAS